MRNLLFVLLFLGFAVTTFAAPAPQTGTLNEIFAKPAGWSYLDTPSANNEQPYCFRGHLGEGTGFVWASYCPDGAVTEATGAPSNPNFGLGLKQPASAGEYCYTRFDTSAPTGSITNTTKYNNPSVVWNCANAGSKITLKIFKPTAVTSAAQYDLAILIRDNTAWWQSSSKNFPGGLDVTQNLEFIISGTGQVTWAQVDMASAGAIDMEDVDAGGEGAFTLGTATNPNLGAIEGIGVIITSTPTDPANTWPVFDEITLEASAVSSVQGWTER